MPHGGFLQARQAMQAVRYLPRWQQTLIALVLAGGGVALLVLGDPIGVILLLGLARFLAVGIMQRRRRRRSPG